MLVVWFPYLVVTLLLDAFLCFCKGKSKGKRTQKISLLPRGKGLSSYYYFCLPPPDAGRACFVLFLFLFVFFLFFFFAYRLPTRAGLVLFFVFVLFVCFLFFLPLGRLPEAEEKAKAKDQKQQQAQKQGFK
jgi:hypothetical protein